MIPPNTALNATSSYAPSTAAFLTSLGLDAAHVQPQTCQACHDSHMTRLRLRYVSDDPTSNNALVLQDGGTTDLTPAGFVVKGVGKGALCMTCHMKYNPQSFGTAGPTGMKFSGESTNHTFQAQPAATDSVCVNCHNASLTDNALQGQVSVALADVRAAILAKVNAAIGTGAYTVVAQLNGGASSATVNLNGGTNPIVGLDFGGVHGNKALVLTLKSATTVGTTSTNTITALMSDVTVGAVPVIGSVGGSNGAGGTFADYTTMGKAIWNYLLISQDGSLGVHNPTFALDVLSATKARVAALTAIPY